MTSWIEAIVEEGDVTWYSAGGEWHTEEREDYIREGYDMEHFFSETPALMELLDSLADDVFYVRFTGISYVVEEGGWNLEYGYDYSDAYVTYDDYELVSWQEMEGLLIGWIRTKQLRWKARKRKWFT